MNTRVFTAFALVLALTLRAWSQGPLDPPGPPGPQMKALDQIDPGTPITQAKMPMVISIPGSYYATEDLTAGGPNGAAIRVLVGNVTIDLRGHALVGDGTGSFNGIYQESTGSMTVQNGSIQYFGANAVLSYGKGNIIRNLRISNCAYGISAGDNALVESCTIHSLSNSSGLCMGIYVGDDAVVRNSTVSGLRGGLVTAGINLSARGIASQCTVSDLKMTIDMATADGIVGGRDALISDCSVTSCRGVGFRLNGGSLRNSMARSSDCGVRLQDGARADQVVSVGNTNGILVYSKCTVSRCTVNNNTYQGIDVEGSRNVITDNTCNENTSSGIFVFEDDNRIEGNAVVGNDFGIYLRYWSGTDLAERNIVQRNTASRSTTANYFHMAGNAVAPIDAAGAFTNAQANVSL